MLRILAGATPESGTDAAFLQAAAATLQAIGVNVVYEQDGSIQFDYELILLSGLPTHRLFVCFVFCLFLLGFFGNNCEDETK